MSSKPPIILSISVRKVGKGGTIIVDGNAGGSGSQVKTSYTGNYLKPILERDRRRMEQQIQEMEKRMTS